MVYEPIQKVKEFMEAYDQPVRTNPSLDVPEKDLRKELVREEAQEFTDAIDDDDLIGAADALGDLLYVIYGAAHAFGIPLDDVFNEIHGSNMSKLGADGKAIKRADGKVLKGPNYYSPDLAPLLRGRESA